MSALRPDSNKGHDLGSSSVKWGSLHVGDVQAESMTTSGNVEIQGNLTVTGTQTSLQVSTVEAEDPLIKLARNNTGDAIDIGFYGRTGAAGSEQYHGLARDADDGKFYLVKDLSSEPSTTLPTLSGTNKAVLVAHVEGDITGALTGNADTASALETARTISLSGDVAGSVSFDGSGNVDIVSTIQAGQVENSMMANSTITLAGDSGSQAIDLGDTLTIQGTANEIVTSQSGDTLTIALPDSVSGLTSVSATSFTGALTGNASTASALETSRTLSLSGDVAGSVSFDGSGNADIVSTIQSGAVENSMLANDGFTLKLAGVDQEDINLGES
jgi:cytoskeletal protein CcmA (bactofilin family)